jgi:hypothetical protein
MADFCELLSSDRMGAFHLTENCSPSFAICSVPEESVPVDRGAKWFAMLPHLSTVEPTQLKYIIKTRAPYIWPAGGRYAISTALLLNLPLSLQFLLKSGSFVVVKGFRILNIPSEAMPSRGQFGRVPSWVTPEQLENTLIVFFCW